MPVIGIVLGFISIGYHLLIVIAIVAGANQQRHH
jgi:hypothetical protein